MSPLHLATRGAFDVDLPEGDQRRSLIAWLVFHIVGGQILLVILLATFIFTRAKRHPTLVNMVATWSITSFIACLVFYGEQYHYSADESQASEPLCQVQAVMMQHAVPAMLVTSAFALIYHVWTTARTSAERQLPKSLQWIHTLRTALLVFAPYLALGIFSIAGAINVITNPAEVSLRRRKFYCAVEHSPISVVAGVYYAVVLLVTAVFQVRIVLTLRRSSTGQGDSPIEETSHKAERALLIRVMIFGVYVFVGFILAVTSLFFTTVAPDMFIATVPVVVFFVFGCQKDVLEVWFLWRRDTVPKPRPPPPRKGQRIKIEDLV